MKNGDMPIYPDPMRGAEQSYLNQTPDNKPIGLTKREYFAAMAIQGYIAAGGNGMPSAEHLAAYATSAADALLSELEK